MSVDDEPEPSAFCVGDTYHTRHLLPVDFVWSRVDDKISAWAAPYDGTLEHENLIKEELCGRLKTWGYSLSVKYTQGWTSAPRPLQAVAPNAAGSSAAHAAIAVDPSAQPEPASEPPATVSRAKRARRS